MGSEYAFSMAVLEDGTMQAEWLTEAFARDFDLDPEGASELGVFSVVHPDDHAEADRALSQLRAGKEYLGELRLQTREGESMWTILYARPAMNGGFGRLLRVHGAAVDISDRKEAERRLEQGIDSLAQAMRDRAELQGRVIRSRGQDRPTDLDEEEGEPVDAMATASRRLEMLAGDLSDRRRTEELRETLGLVNQAAEHFRRMMVDLKPEQLDNEGIAAALWAYMEGARLQTGMNYRLENRLLAEPDESVQDLVYRIAQEALDNVRRHARAEHVEVLVATREGGVFVRVWDDGLGFTAQEVLPEHSGLVSMRERAQLAGGWCRVQSLPALGTKVEFWLPVAGTATSEPAIETIANWSA